MVLAGVLASPAAAAWLFDRAPVGALSAAAVAFLASAPTYQDVMVPLGGADHLPLGPISQGAPPLAGGGAPPEAAGNQLLYMPCAVANGFVFGTFFGDNKPPVPGPCPEPTASRWVFDAKTGAMVILTWFPDDKVAVTSTQCTRYGEWSYDLNFFYGVTEGTLPVHRAMSAQYRTTRHCLFCVARHTPCQCSTPMRERRLLDMEHAQPTDFTASRRPPASELAAMSHWADWHSLRRTGTFSATATLTHFSSTAVGVAPAAETFASTWSVGNLSPRRAAGLRAGLAAHLNPPAVRAAWPSQRRAVGAPPPPPAAATTADDEDGGGEPPTAPVAPPPPRAPARPTRPAAAGRRAPAAAGAAPPSAPAAPSPPVAARAVARRRRRRSGAHHSLYYDVAVRAAAPALGAAAAAAVAAAATRAPSAAPPDAASDGASAAAGAALPPPCAAAPAARRDGGAPSGGGGGGAPRRARLAATPRAPPPAAPPGGGGRGGGGGGGGGGRAAAGSPQRQQRRRRDSSGGVAAAVGHDPRAARGARRAPQSCASGSSDGGTGSSDDLEDVPVGSPTPPPAAASATVGVSRSSPVAASVCGARAGVPPVSLLTASSPSVDVDGGGWQGACAASEDEGLLSSLGDAPFGGAALGVDACVWDDTLVPSLWKGGESSGGGGGVTTQTIDPDPDRLGG
ncbi:hypothetical protein BU14_0109s0035 [Porphyra umbilicalis]|uniref:Uncharacterized protein n=2 Tax=Porphyra umbilicalis TaxID=2786 RepID=A0A1X6PCG8_PORUM|nr:hypothetical protein BU14_0109s0035 [Porphyra umbilicalis]|eukprot:OSX78436.1 hypothetical protein BU14_0109s0035 [Porphyra umbilicalis]